MAQGRDRVQPDAFFSPVGTRRGGRFEAPIDTNPGGLRGLSGRNAAFGLGIRPPAVQPGLQPVCRLLDPGAMAAFIGEATAQQLARGTIPSIVIDRPLVGRVGVVFVALHRQ